AEDIAGMREAGRLASELLDYLTAYVRSGVTTREIDTLAHEYMVNEQHTIPATLNYAPPGHTPYPASLCTSVNHVVCHGIPGDNGSAIQRFAEGHGFSVVREFCGHGIGKQFHEEPQVLHYGRPGTGYKIQPGMVFTVEPMINAGRPGIRCLADGWTIVTADHSLSAQWEHTVLVTADGYEIMTQSAGTPAPPPETTLVQAS